MLAGNIRYAILNEGYWKMEYEDLTTDQLLEALPQHLHAARNDNAEPHDRWRIYNMASREYIEPGKASVRDLLITTLQRIDHLSISDEKIAEELILSSAPQEIGNKKPANLSFVPEFHFLNEKGKWQLAAVLYIGESAIEEARSISAEGGEIEFLDN